MYVFYTFNISSSLMVELTKLDSPSTTGADGQVKLVLMSPNQAERRKKSHRAQDTSGESKSCSSTFGAARTNVWGMNLLLSVSWPVAPKKKA